MRTEWQYVALSLTATIEVMNMMGGEGWELVLSTPSAYIFKRPVTPDMQGAVSPPRLPPEAVWMMP